MLLAHSIIRTAIDANSLQMFSSFAVPDIFIRSDGGFGTIWQANNTGTGNSINMQLFNAAGNTVGSFFTVAGNIPNSSLGIDFAVDAAANGNFAVAYKFQNSSSTSSRDDRIVLRRYDADGLTIGSAITVLDGDTVTDVNSVDVAVRQDGQIIVAWAERATGGLTSVKFRRYSAAGALQGSTVTVASESFVSTESHFNVSVSVRDGGNAFALGWVDDAGSTKGLYVRQYNADNTAVASAVRLVSDSVGYISDQEIDLDSTGNGYMHAAIVPGAQQGSPRPHYIRFNTSGTAIGSLVQITNSPQSLGSPRGVAVSPGGKALFGHTGSMSAGFPLPHVSRTDTSATLLSPPLNVTGELFNFTSHSIHNIDTIDDDRYVVLYSLFDSNNDRQLRVAIVSIDDIPPTTPAAPTLNASSDTGISNSDRITSDTTPTLSGTTEPNATIRIYTSITGSSPHSTVTANSLGNWTRTLPELFPANGDQTILFSVEAVDTSGNVSARSTNLSVRIDTVAPPAPTSLDLKSTSDTGTSSTDNITADNTPSLVGNMEIGATVTLRANGITNAASTTYNSNVFDTTLTTLADGSQTITAFATDVAGNTSPLSAALNITIDTVAPATPTVAPDLTAASDTGFLDNDNITSDLTPTFTGSIPANHIARLTIGAGDVGADFTTSTGIYEATVTFTTDGARSIALVVEDLAGNRSTAGPTLSFTIDTVAPPAPSLAPDLLSSSDTGRSSTDNITSLSSVFVSLPLGSSSIGLLEIDGVEVRRSSSLSTGPTLQATGVAEGLRTLRSRAVDAAGNVSGPGPVLNVTFDYTAPLAVNGSLDPGDDAGPSNTDQITNVTLPRLIGTGAEAGAIVTAAALDNTQQIPINFAQTGSPVLVAADGSFSVIADASAADGTYAYATRFVDVAGNVSFFNAPIPLVIDTVAPTLIGTSFDINTRAISATFTKTVFATPQSTTGYQLLDLATGIPVPSAISDPAFTGDTASFTFDPTLPRGTYALNTTTALATDLAGNAAAPASVEFFILPGDANRDGVVDAEDLTTLTANYGQTGRVFTQGNFDYSPGGAVGLADLVLLTRHYQPGPTALAEPGSPTRGAAPLASLTIALPGLPAGLDLSRFTIQRNLEPPVSLAGSGVVLASPIPGAVTLANLSAATTQRGLYRITLNNIGWTAGGAPLSTPVEFRYHNYLVGDMNSDGQVNNLDIAPFVQGLTSPSSFATSFGYAPDLLGDVNQDGAFNNLDIAPFVALLTGGRSIAEPTRPPARLASGNPFSGRPLGVLSLPTDDDLLGSARQTAGARVLN